MRVAHDDVTEKWNQHSTPGGILPLNVRSFKVLKNGKPIQWVKKLESNAHVQPVQDQMLSLKAEILFTQKVERVVSLDSGECDDLLLKW